MYPLSTSGFGGLFFKECLSLTAALFSWDKSFWLPSWILAHEGDHCFKPFGSVSWVFFHGFAKHLSQTERIWTLKKYNHFQNCSAPSWSHFGFLFHRGLFLVISSLCVFLETLCTESHWWLSCAFCMLERITGLTATHALKTEILNKPYGRSNGFTFLNVSNIPLVLSQSMSMGRGVCRCFELFLMYCISIKLEWKHYVFLF